MIYTSVAKLQATRNLKYVVKLLSCSPFEKVVSYTIKNAVNETKATQGDNIF